MPILIDARAVKNAKRMFILADLNPFPEVIDMKLNELEPFISLNIKIEQSTPIRAVIQDADGVWHVGGAEVSSFGGGCSVDTLEIITGQTQEDLIGQSKGKIIHTDNNSRIRWKTFHPMSTGLFVGGFEFYLTDAVIKNKDKIIGELSMHASVSSNPHFILESKNKYDDVTIELKDTDGNEYTSHISKQL